MPRAPECWIACKRCRASSDTRSFADKAIAAWNTRTPPLPSVSGEREAFEAWVTHDGEIPHNVHKYANGNYLRSDIEFAWIAWQAARTLSIGDRDRGYAEGLEAAIAAVKRVGNFGDYKREELTADYGQSRFDMMLQCLDAIRTLSPNKES